MKHVVHNLMKFVMVFLLVAVSYVLVETIKEKYYTTPNDGTETATDKFSYGLRPNIYGKITFGLGSDDGGFNFMDVFSFED